MKQMRTALVRTDLDKHYIYRYDCYNSQKDFATDLRGNGYKVLKIWNGDISDDAAGEWLEDRTLLLKCKYQSRKECEEKFANEETDATDKPYMTTFYTFDGSEDDVTASMDADFQNYSTVKEAYKAGQDFQSNCDGYHFAGWKIEDEHGNWIYECTEGGGEHFYINDREVDFDTFNAKYNVHTYYFNKELDELFDKFENASETIYKADYLNNDKARIAAINERADIRDEIFNAAKNYEERYNGEIGGEMQLRIENAEEKFEDWKTKYEMLKKMDAEDASPAEKVATLRTIDAEEIVKTNEIKENESMETAYTVYVKLQNTANNKPVFTKVDYANNLANAVSTSNSKRRRWDVYAIKNAANLKGFDDVRDAAQKVLDEGFDSFTVGDYINLTA